MDPLTHGLVGIAISAFSGSTIGLDNPLTIGAMLGAMSPDLDIVIRLFKNDAVYLEHHRGISHTVPFLAGFSIAITVILSFLGFFHFSFLGTLFWTFLGALSHTGLDILNSYGAKLFKKKFKLGLLTLYDPVITGVGLWFIINGQNSIYELLAGVLIVFVYLLMRNLNRHYTKHILHKKLSLNYSVQSITVMPSLKAFYKWDFVANTNSHDIVGQYNPWYIGKYKEKRLRIIKTLDVAEPYFYDLFRSFTVGEIFSEFSPNLHIEVVENPHSHNMTLKATDLRFYFKENFLHHATLTMDNDHNYISGHLHPYKFEKAIPVYQG